MTYPPKVEYLARQGVDRVCIRARIPGQPGSVDRALFFEQCHEVQRSVPDVLDIAEIGWNQTIWLS